MIIAKPMLDRHLSRLARSASHAVWGFLLLTMGCHQESDTDTGPFVSHDSSTTEQSGRNSTDASTLGYLVTQTEDILQYIQQPDLRTIVVHTVELATAGSPNESVFTYSASFDIECIEARAQDDYFVAGEARNGDLVIERWQIGGQQGALRVDIQPAGGGTPPLGQPLSSPSVSTVVVGGGSWVPVSQRPSQQPGITRTEILRTSDLAPIRPNALGADPEGRFILFVTDDDILYQLDLTSSISAASPLYDATTLWTVSSVRSMAQVEVTGLGRVWVLGHKTVLPDPSSGGANKIVKTLLYDSDNDGVFEQGVVHYPEVDLEPFGFNDAIVTDFAFIWP